MSRYMKRSLVIFSLSIAALAGISVFVWGIKKSSINSIQSNVQLEDSRKLQVTASFYPLYFFSQQIGGDKFDVTNVVPSGAEPHDYEPTAQDMARMEKADLIVLNGGGFEAWGDRIGKNLSSKNTVVVRASEGLMTRAATGESSLTMDPHVWIDPVLAKRMVENIASGFERVDPENASYYRGNADSLIGKLSDVDAAYRNGLRVCATRNIITSHSAFGYLAAEYGLNQVSIAGLSPDAEPSPSQLAIIAQFAKTNNVQYIFFESLASPKLSQTIATEIGAKTLVLNPIEGLSEENIARGEDYFSVMRENLENLQTALQCIRQ